MKVIFVHPSHPSQFTNIAYRLAERTGWECACLVNAKFTDQIKGERPPIAFYGFREESIPENGTYYIQSLEEGARRGKAVVEALSYIKAAQGVDLVVGHASFGTTFFVRQILNIPVVSYVELPGYFPIYCREEFPAQYPQFLIDVSLRALINSSVLQSDLCIVPSHHAKRLFHEALQDKIRVQMEGFSVPEKEGDKIQLRRELGLRDTVPILGFAARTLEAVRGFDVFAKMAKKIHQQRKDVQFLVIGDETTLYGNESIYLSGKSFKQFVMESLGVNGEVYHFKPFMPYPQFMRHLQAMDLIVFPLFEGAANWGLFEAMASGIPILASRSCFVPEVINHGYEGLLCDASDIDGFANSALDVLNNPDRYKKLGLKAQERIARDYSLEQAVDGYATILKEAVRVSKV